ncbi:MFS transporter [Hydrogenophaga sp. 5NK40-0174]|uniref:MFS transporter n=1 Tax=Hydrogenophaga sp. 5NK40-0174 TaxID=3127649 RepID=UPI00310A627C
MSSLADAAQSTPTPWGADAKVIGLVSLAHAASHFSHLLLAPLFPVFMREFNLSFTDVGLLMSIFFVVSGVGQAAGGFLVDRVGARPVLFAALGCFFLAALTAAQATGYTSLMLAAMLAGLGNAPFHPVDFTILNRRVSASRLGYAFSAHGLAGNLGWALAPVFLTSMAALANWRWAYVGCAGLYAVVVALLFFHREHLFGQTGEIGLGQDGANKGSEGSEGGADGSTAEGSLSFLRSPVVWACFAFFMLGTMSLAVIQSFAPSILERVHGLSDKVAAYTLSAYMLAGAVGIATGGYLVHRVKHSDRVLAVTMLAGGVLLMVAASGVLGGEGTLVVLAATGFAVGIGGPSRDLMIRKAAPAGATGRVYGTVYSGLDVGFALSPLLFGRLMDAGHYAATLAGAGVALLLAMMAVVCIGRYLAKRPSA